MKGFLLGLLCFVAAPGVALAGALTITPVHIIARGAPHAEVITFKNDGGTAKHFQAEVEALHETSAGAVSLTQSTDVLVSPPVLTVPAHSTRILRVLLMRPPVQPLYYHLVLRPLDAPVKAAGQGHDIFIRLSMALPMAFEPATAAPAKLAARMSGSDLLISNAGGSHAAIYAIGPHGAKPWKNGALGWVLPGGALLYHVPAKAGESIAVKTDAGVETLQVE